MWLLNWRKEGDIIKWSLYIYIFKLLFQQLVALNKILMFWACLKRFIVGCLSIVQLGGPVLRLYQVVPPRWRDLVSSIFVCFNVCIMWAVLLAYYCFVWSQYDGGNIEQRTIGCGCRQNQDAKLKNCGRNMNPQLHVCMPTSYGLSTRCIQQKTTIHSHWARNDRCCRVKFANDLETGIHGVFFNKQW